MRVKKTLAETLNFLLSAKGVSQSELARATKIPQATISRAISKTHKSINVEYLKKIANYFGISVDQLVGEQDLDEGIPKDAIELIDWSLFFSISKPLETESKKTGLIISEEDKANIIQDLYIKLKRLKSPPTSDIIHALLQTKLEQFL